MGEAEFDIFVSALDSNGNSFLYSTYLGGNQEENQDSGALAVDAQGQVSLTGWTNSTDFPTAHAFQPDNAGGWDAFLTKLHADGDTLLYSTYLGSYGDEAAHSLALDNAGNAVVTGWTRSDNFPLVNAFQPLIGGGTDIFTTKFMADGSQLWYSTYLGGEADDIAWDITTDSVGNTYITGQTWSTRFPTVYPFQSENRGGRDAVLAKIGILDIAKTLPATFQADAPARYTLTITNTGSITLTDLVVTHPIPSDARYESGGTQIDDIINWTIDRLPAESTTNVQFELASAQPITTTNYRVSAADGYEASGDRLIIAPQPATSVASDSGPSQLISVLGFVLLIMLVLAIGWSIQRNKKKTRSGFNKTNPYIAGTPISNPNMFFGREKQMHDILQGVLHNHIAVEGPRRIGKTSMLIQLEQHLRTSDDSSICFIPMYVDCQRITEEQFFSRVMRLFVENSY